MIEEWKTIKEFENYKVSNLGRIKDINDNIIKQYKNKKTGYVFVNLYKDNKNHIKSVHRLVAKTFIENPNNFETVDHIDCNKENNIVSNLQWMSQKSNWYKFRNSEKYNEYIQKKNNTYYIKRKERENKTPIKKRCYIFNNIIFLCFNDISNYLNKDKVNTRHFLHQNRIKKDFILLLLNGNIIQIEDIKGNIKNKENIKFYNKKDKYIQNKEMKLLMADHPEYGTWYFTNLHRAEKYTKVSHTNLKLSMYENKRSKGWQFQWIEDENIINKYINPEP